MKILFVPPSPKAGTTEHCENAAGRALILAGFAQEVKYNDFRERLAAEAFPKAEKTHAEWGVQPSDGGPYSQNVIIKKLNGTTTFYAAPPEDCPRSIVERFNLLVEADKNNPAETLAAAKRNQAEYDARMKTAKRY
jgi:hypothetical protein